MDKSQIIKRLVDYYAKGNQTKFAQMLGVVPMTISSWIKRNTFDIDLIYAKCLDISPEWLLTGEGDMLRGAGQTVVISGKGGNNAHANSNCTISQSAESNATIAELKEQLKQKDEQVRQLLEIVKNLSSK